MVVSDEGDTLEIFNRTTAEADRDRLSQAKIEKLPVEVRFVGKATTTESGIPGQSTVNITVSFNDPQDRKTLQPLDKGFRVDYEPLKTFDWGNVGVGGKQGQFLHAHPVAL